MRYNGTCSAGVAHLAERHLAKVEVASSNLVARSRQTHLLRQVGFCHPGALEVWIGSSLRILDAKR